MQEPLMTFAGSKNFRWEISPADSPWRQGKAERRISIVKRLIKLSVGDTRLTPIELQTSLMEIANLCNERPIGIAKPSEDGVYSLQTSCWQVAQETSSQTMQRWLTTFRWLHDTESSTTCQLRSGSGGAPSLVLVWSFDKNGTKPREIYKSAIWWWLLIPTRSKENTNSVLSLQLTSAMMDLFALPRCSISSERDWMNNGMRSKSQEACRDSH